MSGGVTIAVERPDQPDVAALLAESVAYSRARYPAASDFRLPLADLLGPAVTFFVLRRDGEALGAAALYRASDGAAELKSMVVAERARGLGFGRRLVEHVVACARAEGHAEVVLETGVRSDEALGLYERCGFVRRARFGSYPDDPLSVFMAKPLQ